MKKVVAVMVTLISVPIFLLLFSGSASLFANTGDPSGFLIDTFLILVIGAMWYGASKGNLSNHASWGLVLLPIVLGCMFFIYMINFS
jgi:hypothetical protein